MTDSFSSESKAAAQQSAYTAVKNLRVQSTSILQYQSSGRVLIIGEAQEITDFGALPKSLTIQNLNSKEWKPDDEILLQGALGRFTLEVGDQNYEADMVLDLLPTKLLSMEMKPPGYFTHVNSDDEADAHIKAALIAELTDMVGTFDKPKYFDYDASLCAHGRSGQKGCTRCLDACPAEAISSLGNLIEVDNYLCQGGGICSTVCPSGAIRYAYPKSEDLLSHVRTLITAYLREEVGAPTLVFVTESQRQDAETILPSALMVTVEEVASVGTEICLSAIAWGAREVRLFDVEAMPKSARFALDLHLEMLSACLLEMGFPSTAVAVVSEHVELLTLDTMPLLTPAVFAATNQKRQAFYLALDHLYEQSILLAKAKPDSVVNLPAGSVFGETMVNAEACTLCMACVSACPGNALQDGADLPQLGFIESNCLQCNVCVATCPEGAMSISPRLLLDPKARKQRRVLHEESPFCCVSCGKPFATKKGITNIMSKLLGHAMFEDERALERLKMCGDCRVKDMMDDPKVDL